MAMPAWAYYYQQVFNDKSLNIDPGATFIPPANMQNEVIFDYSPAEEQSEIMPIEGDEQIPGNEYIEIPISDGKEKVVTESQRFDEVIINKDNPKPTAIPEKDKTSLPKVKDSVNKRKGGLNRVFGGNQKD
jgi:hypothetical protein